MSTEKKTDVRDKATKEKDSEVEETKEQKKAQVPDPPDCDPALGDLTPAYIEWVKKFYPDDFKARYQGRIPEVPQEKREKFNA
jgi:hypothetical protein